MVQGAVCTMHHVPHAVCVHHAPWHAVTGLRRMPAGAGMLPGCTSPLQGAHGAVPFTRPPQGAGKDGRALGTVRPYLCVADARVG